jgi:type I restriction enzyme, S subunit
VREGWRYMKIGDLCKTSSGGTPLKSKKEFYEGGDIPWLMSGEVSEREIFDCKNYITEMGLTYSSAKIFPKNSILVAMYGATAGQVGILRFEAASNQAICAIYPNNLIVTEYLYYALLFKKTELIATASGNAQPNISQIKIKNTIIPLPPLPEQKRIVSILDTAFTAIDKAIANTEKNIKNAQDFFESYLNKVFSEKGEGWEEKRLGEVAEVNMGQSPEGSSYNSKGCGLPLINGPTEFGGVDPFLETKAIKFTTQPKKICKKGDLILCVRGSTTGRMNIAGFDSCIGRGVASISSDHYQEWLNQYISFCRKRIFDLGTGSTFPNISSEKLINFLIPIPPNHEVNFVVTKIKKIHFMSSEILSIKNKKIFCLNSLKSSILQKAFTGELTSKSLENLDLSTPEKNTKNKSPRS